MATTDTSVQALRDFLKSERTKCGCGVAADRLADFERQNDVRIPDDLTAYFSELNGTDGDYAYGIIRFWALNEIDTLQQELQSNSSRASVIQSTYGPPTSEMKDFFVFADHMHEAQLYAIRLKPASQENIVVMLDGGEPVEVASSFSDFMHQYLTNPEALRLTVD
jgi:hypothetical protein